ncbi:MAG: type II toxin-antitoxin system RelE/ParE family toxin [Verrucomicrobiota bacterium]
MIQSFACRQTEQIFNEESSRRLPHEIQRSALRKLIQLNQAMSLAELMCPPGNQLEALKGNRKGQYSIRINQQWRICFAWHNSNAYDVEIVDYH